MRHSLATLTQRSYDRLWKTFTDLAFQMGLCPLPVSAGNLEIIVTFFAHSKKSVASVNGMLASVALFHARYGYSAPTGAPRIKLLIRGVSRLFGRAPVQCCPLAPSHVVGAISSLHGDHLRTANFQCSLLAWRTTACTVFSFSSLARFDCLARLSISNIHFLPEGMEVFFPSSKTDQARRGEIVFVGCVQGSLHCPVLFMKAYTLRLHWEAFQRGAFPYAGPLFPALQSSHGHSRPLQRPFTRQAATKAFRDSLEAQGVPDPSLYTLHSGRKGRATAAAMNGCSFLSIKRQGRWRSDACPQRYIDDATARNNHFSRFLGL